MPHWDKFEKTEGNRRTDKGSLRPSKIALGPNPPGIPIRARISEITHVTAVCFRSVSDVLTAGCLEK